MRGGFGVLLVASAAVLWGTTGIAVAFSRSSGLTYLQVAHAMLLVSSCFLLLVLRDGVRRLNPYLFLYGFLVIASFRILYVISISVNGVGLTSALIYVAPLIVVLYESLRSGELPNITELTLSLLAFSGAYVATNPELSITSSSGFLIGLVLALTYSATLTIPRELYARGFSRNEIVVQSTLSAAITLTIVVFFTDGLAVNVNSIPYVTYGGVACMGVAVILFYEGMKTTNPVYAGLVTTLEPAVSLILSRTILGEQLKPIQYVGASIIIAVAIVTLIRQRGTTQKNLARNLRNLVGPRGLEPRTSAV
jgi:drug/metabolite transporter (DMT)-like permease